MGAQIEGFELILNMGLETLSPAKEIFVPVNEISIFSDIPAQCGLPHEFFVLLLKGNIPCTPMYIDRVKALKRWDTDLPSASFLYQVTKLTMICSY